MCDYKEMIAYNLTLMIETLTKNEISDRVFVEKRSELTYVDAIIMCEHIIDQIVLHDLSDLILANVRIKLSKWLCAYVGKYHKDSVEFAEYDKTLLWLDRINKKINQIIVTDNVTILQNRLKMYKIREMERRMKVIGYDDQLFEELYNSNKMSHKMLYESLMRLYGVILFEYKRNNLKNRESKDELFEKQTNVINDFKRDFDNDNDNDSDSDDDSDNDSDNDSNKNKSADYCYDEDGRIEDSKDIIFAHNSPFDSTMLNKFAQLMSHVINHVGKVTSNNVDYLSVVMMWTINILKHGNYMTEYHCLALASFATQDEIRHLWLTSANFARQAPQITSVSFNVYKTYRAILDAINQQLVNLFAVNAPKHVQCEQYENKNSEQKNKNINVAQINVHDEGDETINLYQQNIESLESQVDESTKTEMFT
jgi:hypothetical protein